MHVANFHSESSTDFNVSLGPFVKGSCGCSAGVAEGWGEEWERRWKWYGLWVSAGVSYISCVNSVLRPRYSYSI